MKAHYQVLDGLRGTAAISVVLFHIFELITPDGAHNPAPHGYIAVDFFYALSGFVLGFAYDGRLQRTNVQRLSLWNFAKRRLIRLHPLVPVSVTLGLICYLYDPNVGTSQVIGSGVTLGAIMMAYGANLLLLPSPTLPNHLDETHSLNAPTWTLFWEYIANVIYALWLCRLGRRFHTVLLILSAAALIATAAVLAKRSGLGWGWGYETLWVAPVRLAYPFLAGLMVYRLGWKIALPQPYISASLIVLAVLFAPALPDAYNTLFEALAIIIVFPVTLMVGASIGEVRGAAGRLCRFMGELSYPLYILHYPFVFLYGHWVWNTHPSDNLKFGAAAGLFVFEILLATVLLYAYDKPVRAWMGRKFVAR